ncbi:MAG: hypothetical protein AB7O98_04310 [Hyphomonadaceae bacterium]
MKIRALALALALAACGPAPESGAPAAPVGQEPDAFSLNIEIGRYGVMLGHVGDLSAQRPGAAEGDVESPRELARRLRETVWEYNLTRSQLCGKNLFAEITCGPAYEPVWIAEPSTTEPTLAEIQSRSEDVGAEVMRLWNAVCDDARTRVADALDRSLVCAIE